VVRNDAGVAPGSVHTFGGKRGAGTLYVLPGPPRELASVFANMASANLVPTGETLAVGEVHLKTFEAPVARALADVAAKFADVQFGSYPQHGEMRVIIRFSGDEKRVAEACAELRHVLGHLEMKG
jgi:molybdopterin-biosynthesis enzyme MoeA-like protein